MQNPRPKPHGRPRQAQIGFIFTHIFSEDDMHGNRVGAETVYPRAEENVLTQTTDRAIPGAPEMIGCEPPEEIQEVRSRELRDAMPENPRKVEILHVLAIHVNFENIRKATNPFDRAPLGAVALVKER